MRKKLSANAGIAQLEKLAGGATVLALALGATACGFAPSTEPVASPTGPALVEIADADVSEALLGYSSYSEFQVPRFTNKESISVKVKGYGGKTIGCVSATALTEGAAYACAAPKVPATGLTATASAKTVKVDVATEGLKTVYFGLKGGTTTAPTFSNVLKGTVLVDKTGPTITLGALPNPATDRSVTLTVASAVDPAPASGYAGGLFVAYAVEKNGVAPTSVDATKAANVLKSCSVTGKTIVCTGLKNGKKHMFKVCGKDIAGNLGCSSATAEYSPKAALPGLPKVTIGTGKTSYVKDAAQVWSFTAAAGADDLLTEYSYAYGATLPADSAPNGYNNHVSVNLKAAATLKVDAAKSAAPTAAKPGLIGLAEGINYLWVKVKGAAGYSSAGQSAKLVLDTVKPTIAIQSHSLAFGASDQYELSVVVKTTNVCSADECSGLKVPVVIYKTGKTTAALLAPLATAKTTLTCGSPSVNGNEFTYTCAGVVAPAATDTAISVLAQVTDEAGNASDASKLEKPATGTNTSISISKGSGYSFAAGSLTAKYTVGSGDVELSFPALTSDAGLVGYNVAYSDGATAPAKCDEGIDGGVFAANGSNKGTVASIRPTTGDGSTKTDFSFRVCPVDLTGVVGSGIKCDGAACVVP